MADAGNGGGAGTGAVGAVVSGVVAIVVAVLGYWRERRPPQPSAEDIADAVLRKQHEHRAAARRRRQPSHVDARDERER